jgi:small-conductance mechanosensitive channel
MLVTYESNWRKAEGLLLEIAGNVVKKHISKPVEAVKRDRKSFEDVLQLLHAASKKVSKGVLRDSIQENIETMKTIEQQASDGVPEPNTQISLLDSGIGINVLFVTDIRKNRSMRNEIARNFLVLTEKHSDIELAYPHTQIVYDPRRRSMRNNARLNELVPNLDDLKSE